MLLVRNGSYFRLNHLGCHYLGFLVLRRGCSGSQSRRAARGRSSVLSTGMSLRLGGRRPGRASRSAGAAEVGENRLAGAAAGGWGPTPPRPVPARGGGARGGPPPPVTPGPRVAPG